MPTDPSTIASYNANAEQWVKRMRSGENLSHEYLEKPAMYSLLPDLAGKRVLAIGCGSGEECGELKRKGARYLVGIDLSDELLKIARETYPDVEFLNMSAEHLDFPDGDFDFVYSSLAMHYMEDWTIPLKEVYRVLKPKSYFLFSTHHPVEWGAETERDSNKRSKLLGHTKTFYPPQLTVYGDYLNTRKVSDVWLKTLEVSYYHKPFSSILNDIRDSGFVIEEFVEPKAIEAAKQVDPDFYELHSRLPLFMMFKLVKD